MAERIARPMLLQAADTQIHIRLFTLTCSCRECVAYRFGGRAHSKAYAVDAGSGGKKAGAAGVAGVFIRVR